MLPKLIFLLLLTVFSSLPNQIDADDGDCDSDIDLSLSYWFTFSSNLSNTILNWELKSHTDCPVEYHLIVRDLDLEETVDVYLEDKFMVLDFLSPCVPYQFVLRAVNKAVPTPEGPAIGMTIDFSKKRQSAPTLKRVEIQTTSFNTTFELEGKKNRCPLIKMYIDGGNYFNETVPLYDLEDPSLVPVQINYLRPNSMYYFQVYVENTAGLSPATQLAIQTLEITD